MRFSLVFLAAGLMALFLGHAYGAVSHGVLSNLTVWDDTNDPQGENTVHMIDQQTGFYANFSNGTESAIEGANCTIWFNLTGQWEGYAGMFYSPSAGTFNYSRTFSRPGHFSFNVSCNASGIGYETLNATDGFDIEAPVLTVRSPGNTTYGTSVWLNVTTNGSAWCGYSLDSSENVTMFNSSGTDWYNLSDSVPAGPHYVVFFCNTSDGTMNSSSVAFSVDNDTPVLYISSPLNVTYTSTSVWLNVSTGENASWCGYSLDGAPNATMSAVNATDFYVFNGSMEDGPHNVIFSCNDTAGNYNTSGITCFFVNSSLPPAIIMLSPSDVVYVSHPVWFNLTVSEDVQWCVYSLNGSANVSMLNVSAVMWYDRNYTLQDGRYFVNFTCNDTTGNVNSSGTYFNVSAPPFVSISSPLNQTYNSAAAQFSINTSQPASWCGYTLDGAENVTMSNTSHTLWQSSVSAGESPHSVAFYCNDSEGYGSAIVSFAVSLPPYWYNASTNGSSSTAMASDVYFSVTFADNVGAGEHVFSWFNGSEWLNDTPVLWSNNTQVSITKMVTVVAGQTMQWYWWFNDSSGNSNETDMFSFTLSGSPGPPPAGGDNPPGSGPLGGCIAGSKMCSGSTLQVCVNGTWVDTDCPYGCNPIALECVQDNPTQNTCSPGEKECSGSILRECNSEGSGWSETNCTNGCEAGACKAAPTGCTEGQTRCYNNSLQQCVSGDWFVLENCKYGCDGGVCKILSPAEDATTIVIAMAILGAMAGGGYYFFFVLKKPFPFIKIKSANEWTAVEKKWSNAITAKDSSPSWEELERKWSRPEKNLPEPGELWDSGMHERGNPPETQLPPPQPPYRKAEEIPKKKPA
jgi:hypothetical protein